jgi:hypothetical protein
MIFKGQPTTYLGIRISLEEKESLEKAAKKYKMRVSDLSRRLLRIGIKEDIVKKEFA